MIIDIFLILLIAEIFRKTHKLDVNEKKFKIEKIKFIENILKDARNICMDFEKQINEKRNIVKELNKKLDARIIDLNILIGKVEKYDNRNLLIENRTNDINDRLLEERIILMAKNNFNNDAIAKKLNISKNEVEMIISLKNN
jgi:hypothetical protein